MNLRKMVFTAIAMLFLTNMSGTSAMADLKTIGTATYMGSDYKLIWDDDNNGNSVIWLDYTRTTDTWINQMAWANSLNSLLTYNIDAQYSDIWDDDAIWRLPSTVDGHYGYGYDGTTAGGFNITTSEMGHLYYDELENLGYYGTSGNYQPGYGLVRTDDFENLIASFYWSCTEYADGPPFDAWGFLLGNGFQGPYPFKNHIAYGIAVHSVPVSAVPIPSAIWLFSGCLVSVFGVRRKFKK